MTSDRIQRRIDALLDEADAAIAAGDWERARIRAQDALAFDSSNADARVYLTAANKRLTVDGGSTSGPSPLMGEVAAQAAGGGDPGAAQPQPSSFVGGRYHVRKFLGEGGKKKVFLAHDQSLDRDVAFALIKTEGLDATGRERIVREAQAMGRLGAHPTSSPSSRSGKKPPLHTWSPNSWAAATSKASSSKRAHPFVRSQSSPQATHWC